MTTRLGLPRLCSYAVIGALAFCAAPSPGPASAAEVNSLHGGATSVQFLALGGGYRTPAFRTSGIYLKCHLSDRGALRVGTDFSLDESSGKSPVGPDFQNTRYYSVSVSAEFEEYVDASGPVTVFLGVGPYWTRGRNSWDNFRSDVYNQVTYVRYSRSEYRYWEIGGSVGVGFEWFFKRRLSLLGRVGATLGFGERHELERYYASDPYHPYTDENRLDYKTATAGSSSAALGLGVYF